MRALALFLALFGLYLHDMAPGLAPYRDTGEMAVATTTLGIAHPPSYPLYILVGRAAGNLPLASPAFRVSLLSAAAGAAAVALLFLIALESGPIPALLAAAVLAFDRPFWSVTTVPEMYSLGVFFAVLLLFLLPGGAGEKVPAGRMRDREVVFFSFLAGLFLGNRSDLLLWAPGLALGLWLYDKGLYLEKRRLLRLLGFFALGLTVYVYLPLRSSAAPLLDWNHPADLANLWATITRRSYGGTLDLLSKNYKTGELFLVNMTEYAKHMRDTLGFSGIALAALGVWVSRRSSTFLTRCLLFVASGPLFLFLANLPPNPHALAIVEPNWILPDVLLALWLAAGLAWIFSRRPPAAWAASTIVAGELAVLAVGHHALVDRRSGAWLDDFARNAFHSAPRDSVLVSKKDVQIFGLWYAQDVLGKGAHATPLAQGLSGTPWYIHAVQAMHPSLALGPLREAGDWARLAASSPGGVAVTPDIDPAQGMPSTPHGTVTLVANAPATAVPWSFVAARGLQRYEEAQDFFSADLTEMVADERQALAAALLRQNQPEEAARWARLAWSLKWVYPEPPLLLGYVEFQKGAYEAAIRFYSASASLFDRLQSLAEEFHALPDVKASILKSSAEPWQNLGVVYERSKRLADAEAAYGKALERDPGSSKTWFNLGALYWGRDWKKSAEAFARAAALDPTNAQARGFAAQAAAKAK